MLLIKLRPTPYPREPTNAQDSIIILPIFFETEYFNLLEPKVVENPFPDIVIDFDETLTCLSFARVVATERVTQGDGSPVLSKLSNYIKASTC